MNNLLTIKIFGDIEHKYGPYFRIGYRDKEATFNLIDENRKPLVNAMLAHEMESAADYVGYRIDKESQCWMNLCMAVRDLYVEMRKDHE